MISCLVKHLRGAIAARTIGAMLAMVLERISPRTARPLAAREVPDPVPDQGELLLRVLACAVCRTDLHLVDGELNPRVPLPRIPGHQVGGTVVAAGQRRAAA